MTRVRRFGRDAFRSLHQRNFRLYFVGQIVSVSGTWMQGLAQAWLVLELTGSGVALGITTALQFLPMLLLGGFGGVIADRFDKRRLLLGTNAAAALLAVALGVLAAFDLAAVWNVYVLALLLGFVNAIDNPARQTFVLEMVGPENLQNAVSLNSVVMNAARVVGPGLGGLLIASVGVTLCFFVNAASYVAVIAALLMMDSRSLIRTPTVARRSGQLREGYRYVWSTPELRTLLLMMATIGTLAFNFHVILPLLATRELGAGAGAFGGLTSVLGAGAVIGGLSTATLTSISYRRLLWLAGLLGVSILAVAVAPTLPLVVVTLFVMGVAAFAFIATANATLQLTATAEMRGRVMALYAIAFLGTTPIGSPLVGWIAEQFGPRVALAVGGVATLVATDLARRALRRHRRAERADAGDAAVGASVAIDQESVARVA
ncbi:MAG TPA: MFS transporter [Acidimicrobiia bacterium]|nr:MFS transporter [Acidimicrobiia bacterium]